MAKFWLMLGVALFFTCPLKADEFISGRVTSVYDGDTFRIGSQRIRLWGIDAVELHQRCNEMPCGIIARDALTALIKDRDVACTIKGTSHRRIVAQCRVAGHDIAARLTASGMAFDASHFSRGAYETFQSEARTRNAGLWALQGLETPRNWRARQRSGT